MRQCIEHKGICFILLWFSSLNRCFLIDSPFIIEAWEKQATEKKSLTLNQIEEIGIEITVGIAPRIPFIEAVNQLIELKEKKKYVK